MYYDLRGSKKFATFAADKRNRWQDMRSLRMLRIC